MNEKTTLIGTIAELLTMGITVNGHPVDNAQLSVLTRLFGKAIEKVEPKGIKGSKRGRKCTVWEMDSNMCLNLSVAAQTFTRTTEDEAQYQASPSASAASNDEGEVPEPLAAASGTVETVGEPQETVAAVQEPSDKVVFPWDNQ